MLQRIPADGRTIEASASLLRQRLCITELENFPPVVAQRLDAELLDQHPNEVAKAHVAGSKVNVSQRRLSEYM
jgi:hypothetical protein